MSGDADLPVSIGRIEVARGNVRFSDFFVRPNYTANLTDVAGSVSALSATQAGDVAVDAKVEHAAPVEVRGKVNPFARELSLDLTGKARDVDLPPLTPYAEKYAGYGIEKGKLSFDVHYKIENRKLAADNRLVLDQLTFGQRVDSPTATKLPVLLAVALLKDRNGVIDVNLPISGSLDDPEFSMGGLIIRMIVNLITKVAVAPFAFLGHLFGGDNEHLNLIEFAGGSAELDKPAQDQLSAIAKGLKERPQLKLDVPMVSAESIDRPALAAARLRHELLTRVADSREGRRHPDTAGDIALADPEKHFKLLLAQYQADLGKDKPLPPSVAAAQQANGKETPPYDAANADLSAALLDHIQVPDSDLEALGKQRATAIQGALVSDGQIEASRVFIVNAPAKPQSGDKVKVELSLK